MIVVVCGGRDYRDRKTVFSELDRIDEWLLIECVVEGGQRTFDRDTGTCVGGADWLANRWAYGRRIPCVTEKADWAKWGRAAGPVRNQRMLDLYRPEAVICFPGSAGTADMADRARMAGVRVVRAGVRAVPTAA